MSCVWDSQQHGGGHMKPIVLVANQVKGETLPQPSITSHHLSLAQWDKLIFLTMPLYVTRLKRSTGTHLNSTNHAKHLGNIPPTMRHTSTWYMLHQQRGAPTS